MSKIDDLNQKVTSAIRHAEELEDVKSEFTAIAYLMVSFAEEDLANELSFGGGEWMIAWRGAIRAAVKSGNIKRAKNLIAHLKVNFQIVPEFVDELEAFLQ